MNAAALQSFFMWCTIINAVLMTISFLLLASARDWVYKIHSRWFPISKDVFNIAIYSFLGLYKIIVIAFNLVPWIALAIIAK